MTTISVIVTSYNYEQYISRTLDSLVNQTYKDFEVIIVDDGSKDNSVKIIKEYVSKYPNFYLYMHENNENKGLIESMQLGLSKAQSEWIAFLESDDYWRQDYLQEKINYINTNPESVIIINDIEIEGDRSHNEYIESVRKLHMKNKKNCFKQMYDGNVIGTFSCVMIKTNIIKNLDFNTPIPAWLDWWLWLQVAIKYPISFVDKKLTVWNRHEGSYITVDSKKNEEKQGIFRNRYKKLLFKKFKFYYIKFKLFENLKNILQDIFSIKNSKDKKYKIITILKFQFRLKKIKNL